jgi:hypothetical protein
MENVNIQLVGGDAHRWWSIDIQSMVIHWGVETWKGRNCKMSRLSRLWTRNWNDVLDMPTCLGTHLCWQILACKTEPELHEPEKSANQAHRTQKCRNLMFKIKLCAVRAQLLQRASASRGFQYRAGILRSHRPLRATVRSLWKIASAVLKCGSIWASLVFETSCKTWWQVCRSVYIFFRVECCGSQTFKVVAEKTLP